MTISIHYIDQTEDCYDITVPGNHNFYGNGILVHNCVEVCLPSETISDVHSEFDPATMTGKVEYQGLVPLCILAAINCGNIDLDNHKDLDDRYDTIVVFLNELIDYQDYMIPQSYAATMLYRPLGIGVINFAYLLAKKGFSYDSQEARNLTHKLGEQMYYYFLKATNKYAQYKGASVPGYDKLIYSDGKTLRDTYCKTVDELVTEEEHCDWPTLLADIAKYGVYNATGGALMPSESSSTILNGTSGYDKIRSLVTGKKTGRITFQQVAPESKKLALKYDYLWDTTPAAFVGFIKLTAVFQKWICQSISLNFSYNPDHFPDRKVSLEAMMNHTQVAAKYGCKTRYYLNTKGEGSDVAEALANEQSALSQRDQDFPCESEIDGEDGGCAGGACKI